MPCFKWFRRVFGGKRERRVSLFETGPIDRSGTSPKELSDEQFSIYTQILVEAELRSKSKGHPARS